MGKHLFYWVLLLPFLGIGQILQNNLNGNIYNSLPNHHSLPLIKSDSNFQIINAANYSNNTDSINEDCSQEYAGGYFGALLIMDTGSSAWVVANDLNVEAETQLTVRTLEFEVVTVEGIPTTFSVSFYRADSGGGPGSPVGNLQTGIVPVSITPNGTWGNSGYSIYKVILELPVPPVLQATSNENTRYWVGISGAETTEDSFFIYLASSLYEQNDISVPTWISDGGIWLEYIDAGNKVEGILKITGDCEPLQGCIDALNGQFPNEIFIPSCNGFTESITPNNTALSGQYSVVQITNGTKYSFSSSEQTDFITITDEEGNTLAAGTLSVDWTANFDGNIRFYIHLDNNCNFSENNYRERRVQCGIPVCEDQEVLSNNAGGAVGIVEFGGIYDYSIAFDIPVGETGFTLYGIELNIFRKQTSQNNFVFRPYLYSETNGVPGSLITSPSAIIYDSEIIGTITILQALYDVYRINLQFEDPLILDSHTEYWLQIEIPESDVQENYWESSPASVLGSGYAVRNIPTGYNWALNPDSDLVYSLICEEILNVNDLNSFNFSYYPNPVKDVLNITSGKNIERIDVYNLAGQSVLNNIKLYHGQVNLNSLLPGTYVFRVTLEEGQIETFKIIKR